MGAIFSQAVVALYFDLIRGALDASTAASRKPIGGTGFFPAAWLFYFCRCFGDAETAISRPIDELARMWSDPRSAACQHIWRAFDFANASVVADGGVLAILLCDRRRDLFGVRVELFPS